MASNDTLTDAELQAKLTEFGYPIHPVTRTTRKVLFKKLQYLLEQSNLSMFNAEVGLHVSMNTRNIPRLLVPPRRVFGSGISNTLGSFNQPATSSGVTSATAGTTGGSLFTATSRPTTADQLGATIQPFGKPQINYSLGRVFGSGISDTLGSFNQPATSSGVTWAAVGTRGGSLFTTTSRPITADQLGATTQPFGQPQINSSLGFSTTVSVATKIGLGTVADKFVMVMGTDTLESNGVSWTVRTRFHNITCMKEYQNKSLEELRLEDYFTTAFIHRDPQLGVRFALQPFLFGAGASSATTHNSFFGSIENKPLHGQTNTSLAVQPSLLEATKSRPTTDLGTQTPVFSTPATQDVFSVDVLKHSIERLEEIVRCAVCLERVKPTIVQCTNGHMICFGCKKTLTKCPSCRASFSINEPSRFFEQIIEALPSRCSWANCEQYFKLGDDHELFCEHRLIRCMWDDCQWSGCKSEIYHHISTVHKLFQGKTCIKINLTTLSLHYFDPSINSSYSTSYLIHGHLLWKKTINDAVKKIFTETFYLLIFTKGKPKKDIYVEVVFTSKGPKFTCKIKLIPNRHALEENTVHVPWHMLHNFQDHERKLVYQINITEE